MATKRLVSNIPVAQRMHKSIECLARLGQRLQQIEDASAECKKLKAPVMLTVRLLDNVIMLMVESSKTLGKRLAAQEQSMNTIAMQAAANDQEVINAFPQDQMKAREEVQKRFVEKAVSAVVRQCESDFAERAANRAAAVVQSFNALELAIKRAELEANRPYAARIGAQPGLQTQLSNIRVDCASMGVMKFFDLYCSTLEVGDDAQAELYEHAAKPYLQQLTRDGVQSYVRQSKERQSKAGEEFAVAIKLLNAFDIAARKRLPPEIERAVALQGALEELWTKTCGWDPAIGGNLTAAQFEKRYMTPGRGQPAKFEVWDGWLMRYASPKAMEPRLAPFTVL